MTRFLASKSFTSKDLWGQVKATVRQIEREDGCLIFDDTIEEKAWTDENEIMTFANPFGMWLEDGKELFFMRDFFALDAPVVYLIPHGHSFGSFLMRQIQ